MQAMAFLTLLLLVGLVAVDASQLRKPKAKAAEKPKAKAAEKPKKKAAEKPKKKAEVGLDGYGLSFEIPNYDYFGLTDDWSDPWPETSEKEEQDEKPKPKKESSNPFADAMETLTDPIDKMLEPFGKNVHQSSEISTSEPKAFIQMDTRACWRVSDALVKKLVQQEAAPLTMMDAMRTAIKSAVVAAIECTKSGKNTDEQKLEALKKEEAALKKEADKKEKEDDKEEKEDDKEEKEDDKKDDKKEKKDDKKGKEDDKKEKKDDKKEKKADKKEEKADKKKKPTKKKGSLLEIEKPDKKEKKDDKKDDKKEKKDDKKAKKDDKKEKKDDKKEKKADKKEEKADKKEKKADKKEEENLPLGPNIHVSFRPGAKTPTLSLLAESQGVAMLNKPRTSLLSTATTVARTHWSVIVDVTITDRPKNKADDLKDPKSFLKKALNDGQLKDSLRGAMYEVTGEAPDIRRIDFEKTLIKQWNVDKCEKHLTNIVNKFTLHYTRAQVPMAIYNECTNFMPKMSFSRDHILDSQDTIRCRKATVAFERHWKYGKHAKPKDFEVMCISACEAKYGAKAPLCHVTKGDNLKKQPKL